MAWSWKLARIAGIDVYVHATFLMLVAWIAILHWNESQSVAAVAEGVGFILALFACIVLHEFGHALTAGRYGIRTRDITLLPIGGLARLERMPEQPVQELWVALAGPAVNVVIALLLFVWLQASGAWEPVERLGVASGGFLERVLMANVFLAGFNLLPAFPMDGGRALRALLATRMEYTRATQRAAIIGQGMAILFGFLGLQGNPMLIFIALFVWIGAGQEASMVQMKSALAGIPVRRAMLTDFRTLTPSNTLGEAADLILTGAQQDFPVVTDGRVVGILTRNDLLGALTRSGRSATVGEHMRTQCAAADASEMLEAVLARLQGRDCHTVPVTDRGALIGLVTMDNVGEFLMIQAAERKRAPVGLVAAIVLSAAGAACHQQSAEPPNGANAAAAGAAQGRASACTPLETREPNAPDQRPAFAGQTRACASPSNVAFDVVVLAKGLEHPWAVEPLAGGDLLVTERPGRLRIVTAAGEMGQPIAGVPAVDARGQGGLLDVSLSPAFESDRTIYWSYSEPRQGGNATSVARGVLSADRRRLEQVRVIFQALPVYDGDKHFGSRLAWGQDGMLYVTLGERSDTPMRPQAQQLESHMGKTVRITPDGAAPPDNPFVVRPGARPEIWTLGHRNVQAAAFDQQGRLWEIEHGTRGGDELNLIEKGKNYGWPLVAYGEEYSGAPIRGAVTSRSGFASPVYYWDPVIAPSGAQFYTGDAFPAWRGSLFVGSLVENSLVRLTLENDRVTGEEHLLASRGQRVRDVRQGIDGALYVVTDEDNGELWRIAPRR